jgi:hypothetical protein
MVEQGVPALLVPFINDEVENISPFSPSVLLLSTLIFGTITSSVLFYFHSPLSLSLSLSLFLTEIFMYQCHQLIRTWI